MWVGDMGAEERTVSDHMREFKARVVYKQSHEPVTRRQKA